MEVDPDDGPENMTYALRCTGEVALRRKNAAAIALCEELRIQLETITIERDRSGRMLQDVGRSLHWLASDLLYAIRFELREVLIPFIEVKSPTHEFGTQMFPDYFQWLSDEENHVPGDLVKILEEDMEKLRVAKEHIDKALLFHPLSQGR